MLSGPARISLGTIRLNGGMEGGKEGHTGKHIPELLGINIGAFIDVVGLQEDGLPRSPRAGLHAFRETHEGL